MMVIDPANESPESPDASNPNRDDVPQSENEEDQ